MRLTDGRVSIAAQVAGGQGTIAIELLSQLSCPLEFIFVPVGGGGLISGIAAVLKSRSPGTHIVGCQPVNSAVMMQSVAAGRVLELESQDTLSDGTAGLSGSFCTVPVVCCQQSDLGNHRLSCTCLKELR